MTSHTLMADLVEVYALDALEGGEQVEFEAHLDRCETCRTRLDEARTVTASLVIDSAPPAHVWDRIHDEIAGHPPEVLEFPRRGAFFLALTAVAAAAALTLGIVGVFGEGPGTGGPLVSAARQAADEVGSVTVELTAGDSTVAEVILSAEGVGYVVPTQGLPDLDEASTYQLWVINEDGGVISGGVLGHSPRVSTFTWTDGVSGFALTREVAGGVAVSEGDLVAAVTDL